MKYAIEQWNEEKISPKCVRRGLIELSTMSNGSTSSGDWLLERGLFDRMIDVHHVYRASHQEYRSFQDRPTKEQQTNSRKRSMSANQGDETK